MRASRPERELRFPMFDSRRWEHFAARPDDIFIATPAKCGTTWMQGIVASLLWPDGDAPGLPAAVSPWLEQRIRPIDAVIEQLEAWEHRRFVKTHSPADCIPVFDGCRYVLVYRAPLDALLSWANHRRGLRPAVWDLVNASAAEDGIVPGPRWDGEDMDALFDEWVSWRVNPVDHLASWWERRADDDVLLVHYDDLLTDLDSEMRSVARHLGIDIAEETWAGVVDRCRFANMRASYATNGMLDSAFEGGAERFFHKGRPGRGRAELSDAVQERCDELIRSHLSDEAADWLERGSLAAGWRP